MTRWVCSCSFITEGLKSFITLLLCYVTDGNSSRRNIKYSDINDQPEKKIQDILEIDQDHSSSRCKSSRVINDPTRCAAHRLRWVELFVNINQGWTIWETNQIAIFRTDTAIRFLISSLSSIFTVQKTENMWSKIWTDLYSHEKTNKRLLSFIVVNRRQSNTQLSQLSAAQEQNINTAQSAFSRVVVVVQPSMSGWRARPHEWDGVNLVKQLTHVIKSWVRRASSSSSCCFKCTKSISTCLF